MMKLIQLVSINTPGCIGSCVDCDKLIRPYTVKNIPPNHRVHQEAGLALFTFCFTKLSFVTDHNSPPDYADKLFWRQPDEIEPLCNSCAFNYDEIQHNWRREEYTVYEDQIIPTFLLDADKRVTHGQEG